MFGALLVSQDHNNACFIFYVTSYTVNKVNKQVWQKHIKLEMSFICFSAVLTVYLSEIVHKIFSKNIVV